MSHLTHKFTSSQDVIMLETDNLTETNTYRVVLSSTRESTNYKASYSPARV